MSVPTVTSTTATTSATPLTEAATIAATSAGLSSTPSTLTSGEQNSASLCSRFTAWVSTLLDSISNWLISLPRIGTFFMTPAQFDAFEDRYLVAQINARLVTTNDALYVLDNFRQLRTPLSKMEVFNTILNAAYVTDDIARQFYANLPEEMQNEFKRQIWVANHEQDNGHGIGYGDYVVANEIRGQIARDASALQHYALIDLTPFLQLSPHQQQLQLRCRQISSIHQQPAATTVSSQ